MTWADAEMSTLEDRPRYTPTSCFETFPWPEPGAAARAEIGELAAQLIAERQALCAEREIGLTVLYNEIDEGAYKQIRELHDELDAAVARAYGWPGRVAREPLELRRLLAERHAAIIDGAPYEPFAYVEAARESSP